LGLVGDAPEAVVFERGHLPGRVGDAGDVAAGEVGDRLRRAAWCGQRLGQTRRHPIRGRRVPGRGDTAQGVGDRDAVAGAVVGECGAVGRVGRVRGPAVALRGEQVVTHVGRRTEVIGEVHGGAGVGRPVLAGGLRDRVAAGVVFGGGDVAV